MWALPNVFSFVWRVAVRCNKTKTGCDVVYQIWHRWVIMWTLWVEQVTDRRLSLVDIKHQLSQKILYRPLYLGSLPFNGCLMRANSNYACFMTFNLASVAQTKIPENFKVCISSLNCLWLGLDASILWQKMQKGIISSRKWLLIFVSNWFTMCMEKCIWSERETKQRYSQMA